MYKIGVIGDKDSVLGFMAVGFSVFAVNTTEEAKKTLHKIVKEDFAIIYITEDLAQSIEEDIDKYKDMAVPAIIPIPSKGGSSGYGLSNIKKDVERAVGADILKNE